MTVKQKQHLLGFLGYYVGNVDGDWGTLSKTACKAFQQDHGLSADGVFGDATAKAVLAAVAKNEVKSTATPTPTPTGEWKDIRYFTKTEFKCKCGGKHCNGYPAEIDMTMVGYADEIRHRLGKPLNVNSGMRCSVWNQIQGGVSNSQHLYGTAVDLTDRSLLEASKRSSGTFPTGALTSRSEKSPRTFFATPQRQLL